MRNLFSSALLSTAAVCALSASVAAHADTPVQFTYTGSETVSFSLDPSAYDPTYDGFTYFVSGSLNGTPDNFVASFYPYDDGESLGLENEESTFFEDAFIEPNGTALPLDGDPTSGLAPTVTPGTFAGFLACAASLRSPASGLPPTLAFFQVSGLGNCGDAVSLVVGTPAVITPPGVTPEPSTLALFGTGALGLVGAVRRRRQQA